MRLDRLALTGFKNLTRFEVDFDQSELSTVLIGENGTGKSNVIEALVTIFRDLDLGDPTPFRYEVAYRCHGRTIEIDNRLATRGLTIKVDGESVTQSTFADQRRTLLPDNVFGYYSGTSRRLEQLFDDHQSRYYRRVIAPESEQDDIETIDLRRLFYCRAPYGQLALLTYFAFDSDSARIFLKDKMKIAGFHSALLVLRRPRWASSKPTPRQRQHGDPRFWYAAGLVRSLLGPLWEHSLAPINHKSREQDDYRTKVNTEEQIYIYIRDAKTLRAIASQAGNEKAFFALLETLDIADLLREVRIWVTRDDVDGEIPFHEISDGEKQLLTVLGLMRFTGREESLFLLDEPDTHLNPSWKWNYLRLVREVAQSNSESHVVMTSHDPLTMGGLQASQVQLLAFRDDGNLTVGPPSVDPRGLGFTGILTQIFGLQTTVDPDTQDLLDKRNALLRTESRTDEQNLKLLALSSELKELGFLVEDREPEYALFLQAYEAQRREGRTTYTPDEILAKNKVARRILRELRAAEDSSGMIFILQDESKIPADWLKKVAGLQEQLEAPPDAAARKAFIDTHASVWGEIKDQLLEMSAGKCWYSEAPDAVSDWHVDHFRPKKRALDEDKTEHDGYHWLAFDWKNYRIAGSYSNSPHKDEQGLTRGKWDYFPTRRRQPAGRLAQPRSHPRDMSSPRPDQTQRPDTHDVRREGRTNRNCATERSRSQAGGDDR